MTTPSIPTPSSTVIPPEPAQPLWRVQPRRWWHGLAFVGGLACWLVLIGINVWWLEPLLDWQPAAQMALFVVGALSVTWALAGGRVWSLNNWRGLTHQREIVLVALLTLTALGLRLLWLDDSLRVLVDEAQPISEALQLRYLDNVYILRPINLTIQPYTWLFAFTRQLGIEALGRDFMGLRAASAVVGALTLPAVYLLARELFNRRVALTAAALLVAFPPHLHFSRLAIININDAFFGVWALALLTLALKYPRRATFVYAGACLGMTQYFFEGARLFFPLLIALWLILGGWLWRDSLRGRGRGLAWLALTAVIIAAPVYLTWIIIDAPLLARLSQSSPGADYWLRVLLSPLDWTWVRIHAEQIVRAFALYVVLPDQSLFYGGQTALILPFFVPFFALGLVMLIRRWRDKTHLLLLILLAASGANGLLMLNSASSPHFVVTFPALVILIALGLVAVWERVKAQPWRTALALMALVLIGGQAVYYFGPHLTHFNRTFREARPYPDVEDALLRVADLAPQAHTHLFTPLADEPSPVYTTSFLGYLAEGTHVTTFHAERLTSAYFRDFAWGRDHIFLVPVGDERVMRLLRDILPLSEPHISPNADVPVYEQFLLYYYPGSQLDAPFASSASE